MFIFLQDRKNIIGSFSIKMFRRTDENEILAVTELATDDKPERFIKLGEYPNETDAKSVMKLIFADMKRREQVFKMPKKDGVAKLLKAAAERVALAKKQAAEREAKRIAAEKAAEERKAEKAAKAAAHEKKLAEQAAAKAARQAAREAKAAVEAATAELGAGTEAAPSSTTEE